MWRSAASDSACRPERARASACSAQTPLLQRVARGGLLGGGHDDGVVAEGEQSEHPVLLGAAPQLVERGALERHLGVVGEVGVRLAAPQPEQLLEPVDLVGDRGPVRASPAAGRW